MSKDVTTSIKNLFNEESEEDMVIVSDAMNDLSDYPRFGWDNPKYEDLEEPARQVMSSYQNANKWLDTIKESVLIDYNLVYFSNIIHRLAHTMPSRFDQFGDILHTENLLVPYPATEEFKEPLPNIKSIIHRVYDILDDIKNSLSRFNAVATREGFSSMAVSVDELIADISTEYEFFYRAEYMLDHCSDKIQWDSMIYNYWNSRKDLI